MEVKINDCNWNISLLKNKNVWQKKVIRQLINKILLKIEGKEEEKEKED